MPFILGVAVALVGDKSSQSRFAIGCEQNRVVSRASFVGNGAVYDEAQKHICQLQRPSTSTHAHRPQHNRRLLSEVACRAKGHEASFAAVEFALANEGLTALSFVFRRLSSVVESSRRHKRSAFVWEQQVPKCSLCRC